MCLCTCTCTSLSIETRNVLNLVHAIWGQRHRSWVDEWSLQQLYNWTCFTANLRWNTYSHASAISEDGASLDITADGELSSTSVYSIHLHPQIPASPLLPPIAKIKKWAYRQRVREIEHGSFTLLIMSSTGGVGSAENVHYKRLASLLSACKMEFALCQYTILDPVLTLICSAKILNTVHQSHQMVIYSYSSKTSLPPHCLLRGRDHQSLNFEPSENYLYTGLHTTLNQYYLSSANYHSICLFNSVKHFFIDNYLCFSIKKKLPSYACSCVCGGSL